MGVKMQMATSYDDGRAKGEHDCEERNGAVLTS